MAGTRQGGMKAAATNKTRHGDDFYTRIGSIGGQAKGMKGFALNRERASIAGKIGGAKSRRGPAKTAVVEE